MSEEALKNRDEAAKKLAIKLETYRNENPLILGVPRGGVPMAKIIADHLRAPFDVVLVRKIPAPFHPELAAGAVSESGEVYLNPWAIRDGYTEEKLKTNIEHEMKLIRKRREQFTDGHVPLSVKDRTVIVVDDGIATGATMIAAIHFLRKAMPKKIILAAGVIPPDNVAKLKPLCDDLVVLMVPHDFYGVGQFYQDFSQVEDQEVIRLLSDRWHA
jgi:putative phosphoribosyl transferase